MSVLRRLAGSPRSTPAPFSLLHRKTVASDSSRASVSPRVSHVPGIVNRVPSSGVPKGSFFPVPPSRAVTKVWNPMSGFWERPCTYTRSAATRSAG